jgi:hypothetical protein
VLAAHHDPFQVDGDEPVEHGHVQGDDVDVDGVCRRVGRVVVQDVEPAEGVERRSDHANDTVFVGHVDPDGDRVGCVGGDLFGGGQVQIADDDLGPFRSHASGRSSADTAAAPGHDCDLAVESSHGRG